MNSEFSYKSRQNAIERFKHDVYDCLVIGGGITGAATARDAASRGLKVALVEKNDFASGTSSVSSKLIHGGLRYLENLEFKLVFEALAERAHLLKTTPNMVRPLQFFLPVYKGEKRGMNLISVGLWLYDLLALFRTPFFHQRISRKKMLALWPELKAEGLAGGFSYADASMWDDVMVIENARAAQTLGASVANYVEAIRPLWKHKRIVGFECRDKETSETFVILAKKIIICAGPWTDIVGQTLVDEPSQWKSWLQPSRGLHLVFDAKRFVVPGAMLMTHPEDGRVSFVIPRTDFGEGVVVVGTTDAEAPKKPEDLKVEQTDVDYLLDLLQRFFPKLGLGRADIISTYVGIRPLMKPQDSKSLQQVSREHHVDFGPGKTILVAGGKYTTHRVMAEHIVDFALKSWEEDFWMGEFETPPHYHRLRTDTPVNPSVSVEELKRARESGCDEKLVMRYGSDAVKIQFSKNKKPHNDRLKVAGFPYLEQQLKYALEHEMVLHLDDFIMRRMPLFLARKDHGEPFYDALSHVWAWTLQKSDSERVVELSRLRAIVQKRG